MLKVLEISPVSYSPVLTDPTDLLRAHSFLKPEETCHQYKRTHFCPKSHLKLAGNGQRAGFALSHFK